MANELLLLFHSLSPSPKAGFNPGVLCLGWHDFLTDEQKEQLCLLWLWSLLVLLFLQHVSCCRPGRDVTLFAASKDVTITPTSMALRATCLSPASSKQTLVHPQRHRHKHARSLSPPKHPQCTLGCTYTNTAPREPADILRITARAALHVLSETDGRLKPSGLYRAAIQIA